MTALAWVTDPHFNCLKPGKVKAFGHMLRRKADCCIITGDISEGNTVCEHLTEFQEGFGGYVYFVLGNHDFWYSDFTTVRSSISKLCQENTTLKYLNEGSVYRVGHTQLCGVDGWYDYQAGEVDRSPRMTMREWEVMEDFASFKRQLRFGDAEPLVRYLRYLGQESAVTAREILAKCDKNQSVIFATHVPPFAEASWHNGKLSPPETMPLYSNIALGYVLNEWATDAQYLTTICGHAHSKGVYKPSDKHQVLTGEAQYGNPKINKIFYL